MIIRLHRDAFALFLCALLLTGCGSGGGSTGTTGGGPPASVKYVSPSTPFTVGQAISPIDPMVTGSISSYSVAPALPDGLALNTATGAISGTPQAVSPSTTYTISGMTAGGDVNADVTITVNDVKPAIAYSVASYGLAVNQVGGTNPPTQTGGAVVSWSVSPALPAGLTISQKNGRISGIPTIASPTTTYTVTATNSGGQATASFEMTVSTPKLILDLGLSSDLPAMRTNGGQIVTLQSDGTWLLQAVPSGSTILRGTTFCATSPPCSSSSDGGHPPIDLVGGTLIDALSTDSATVSGVEIRSVVTGAVIATLSGSFSWYYLSLDGSYVCTADGRSLSAWSASSGALLASAAGNFSTAAVVCAAGEMLVADGPAGSNVIQTISVSTGASTTSPPFQGTFVDWFADGSHFITNSTAAVWIYTNAGALAEGPVALPETPSSGASGWGNYFWWTSRESQGVTLYGIGNGATPVLTTGILGLSCKFVQSGSTLGAMCNTPSPQLTVINLSGAISQQAFPVPAGPESYAAAGSQWFVGTESGIVYDVATATDLTLGQIASIAGGRDYFSVATVNGQILSYATSTNTLVSTINLFTTQLIASDSGDVMLAALGPSPYGGVEIFQPASGALLDSAGSSEWSSVGPATLSGSGTSFGVSLGGNAPCNTLVEQVGGGQVLCDTTNYGAAVRISADGTLVADGVGTLAAAANLNTYIYKNGSLQGAVPQALPIAWLDDNDLLVGTYADTPNGTGTIARITGTAIYDASGNLVGPASVPCLTCDTVYVRSPNQVFVPDWGAVVSLPSGALLWQAAAGEGAIAGSEYVYPTPGQVLAIPYSGP